MLTEVNAYTTGPYKELCGLSSDTKPTDVGNGSVFEELDTGLTYIFDAEGDAWVEQPEQGGGAEVEPLEVTENGTYTAPDGKAYSPVTVDVPQGGGGVPESDVNFYDYDGTVVASYTAADFANLTEMPANPDHTADGLTAQGWNWSLADAKAYVADYGMLDIGQMYTTTDGKTHLKVRLVEKYLSPRITVRIDGTATVEWGDGNTSTLTGTSIATAIYETHTYATAGEYDIAISFSGNVVLSSILFSENGNYSGGNNPAYADSIKRVFIGTGISSLGKDTFRNCHKLEAVSMPNTVTSIGSSVFNSCTLLKHLTIPSGVSALASGIASSSYLMRSFSAPSNAGSIPSSFINYMYALERFCIPSNAATIDGGAFNGCYFKGIVIPKSVTSIGATAFQSSSVCDFVKFTAQTPPTISASSAFSSLPIHTIIYVPTGTLTAYTTATNYPNPSTYTYVEY